MSALFGPSIVNEVYTPDRLLTGNAEVVTDTVTITGAAAYARGTLLGQITASSSWTISEQAATDGSQVPAAVLLDNVDVTAGDLPGPIAIAGGFNANAMTFGTGWTAATAKNAARASRIYIVTDAVLGDIIDG